MNPADQPPAVPPPTDTIPALVRGLFDQIDRDLSHLAWLLASRPGTLPRKAILSILKLNASIHELRRQIRD